jgi:hypothetical protein
LRSIVKRSIVDPRFDVSLPEVRFLTRGDALDDAEPRA